MAENERDEMQLNANEIETSIQQQTDAMESKLQQQLTEAAALADIAKNIEHKQLTFEDEMESRRTALDTFLLSTRNLK